MRDQSYTTTIEVANAPEQVYNRITEVSQWFKDKGFKGSSSKLNDEFVFDYGTGEEAHYSKQKLIEVIPGKKIVWLITESKIAWIENNKEEWTNTKIIFEISTQDDKTVLNFTHEGLTPEKECYSDVVLGWNMIIGEWLRNYIVEDKA